MHAVVYRWHVRPGQDEAFQRGWRGLTGSIRTQCGSHGSRLHRADDGTWVAYALWPDRATWEACSPSDPEAVALMDAAVASSDEPVHLEVVDDLLAPVVDA